ncbi:MAG: hypothetical protein ACRCU2_19850 [Planktothrix sp.]
MADIEGLKKENIDLKQQLKVAMQKLAIYEDENLEREGYFALKFWVRQQVDIVKEFKLKDEITKNPKDDKFYDRVKALGEGLKESITDLKILRTELRITQKEDEQGELKFKRTTPESVAEGIGNTAGQNM